MIGTGLGGAAAIFMGRLRLTASEAYDDIVDLGQNVFVAEAKSQPNAKPIFQLESLKSSIVSILERRGYKADTMMVEDESLSKQCRVIVLASSNSDVSSCKFIRTYDSPATINWTVVEAIAATMAIPDWFEPVTVGTGLQKQTLIGASIGHTNPIWEGLSEAKEVFGFDGRLSSVISIGAGRMQLKALADTRVGDNQRTKWLYQVINDCEQTARRLSGYFRNVPAYVRFTVDSVQSDMEICNWDEDSNILLNGRTESYLQNAEVEKGLNRAVANLLLDAGSTTLGQITQPAPAPIEARSVPRLTPYHVPRPEIQKRMEKCLNEDERVDQKLLVIHGMAGSGKTQSASFFERTHRKRYKHVFFIDASSVASIKADLQSAIRSLGGSHSQDTFEDAIKYLKNIESGHWLIIFDNADDPGLPLIDYIPSCDHGHVIITTRNPDLALLAPTSHLNMPTMEEEEALNVLFLAAQMPRPKTKDNLEHVIEICKLVGNLPLALVQVGCYCYSSKTPFSQYQERFKEYRQRLMNMRPSWQLDQYPHSAYTSISLSYSLLGDLEKSFLHLLAFFHPFSIRIDIFRTSAKRNFSVDPDGQLVTREDYHENRLKDLQRLLTKDEEWDQTHVDELLMRLQSLSLLSLASDDDSAVVTIHPLVQSFAQDILAREDFDRYLYLATITLSGCVWDEETPIYRYLPQHIFEVESQKSQSHLNDSAAFAYLFKIVFLSQEALHRWRQTRGRCDERLGSHHRSTLLAGYWVAGCLNDLGKYEEAEIEIRATLSIQEEEFGRTHPDTARSYLTLVTNLQFQGKYEEADVILRDYIEAICQQYGENHPMTLETTLSLGLNLYGQERFSEAEILFRRIIPIMTQVLREGSLITSMAIIKFSQVLLKLGKWEEAEPHIRNEVEKRARWFGLQSLNTMGPLKDLSVCFRHRGDLKEAERIQRFVLEITEKQSGKNHIRTIEARESLEETLRLKTEGNKTSGHNRKLGFMPFILVVAVVVLARYIS